MIGIGFLIALGPVLTILLAVIIAWAFVRRRSRMPGANDGTSTRPGRLHRGRGERTFGRHSHAPPS